MIKLETTEMKDRMEKWTMKIEGGKVNLILNEIGVDKINLRHSAKTNKDEWNKLSAATPPVNLNENPQHEMSEELKTMIDKLYKERNN